MGSVLKDILTNTTTSYTEVAAATSDFWFPAVAAGTTALL